MLENIKFPESTFYVPQVEQGPDDEANIESLFQQALAAPVDFPTMDQFILEGDFVAIALLANLPCPVEALSALVGGIAALEQQVRIAAVISPIHARKFGSEIKDRLGIESPHIEIGFVVHDADDQEMVSCIANNQDGEPVYINREMFDADVVITVGTELQGNRVLSDSFYPEFSNRDVINRFKNCKSDDERKQLDGEVRMAEQNLGADFSVLVVPGPGGKIVDVRAGSLSSIRHTNRQTSDSVWSIDCQIDGEVVIATIEGNSEQQSWEDVFSAIAAAAASSQDVQQIVIYCKLSVEPNFEQMDLLQLQFEVDLDTRCSKLRQLSGVHQVIPGILESTPVYLKSNLSQDCVEEAGLGYIESDQQVQRIVDRAASGILLRDAHLCRVSSQV